VLLTPGDGPVSGAVLPANSPLPLRTVLAAAAMVAIGIVVGWMLGRSEHRWPRLW
jgi:hypothetical protein